MHADQTTVAYRAPVQHGCMAHSDAFANKHRMAWIDVDYRTILHVAPGLDVNKIVIAADDCARPNAHAVSETDLSDHSRVRGDERRVRYLRTIFIETEYDHALLLSLKMLVRDAKGGRYED
jgi:hypothetical protein